MKTILVTGPAGYIGGRLIPRLLAKGYTVRCLARRPDAESLAGHSWAGSVEILKGDVYKNEGLEAALAGTDAAYYLVHSMADVPGFEKMEEVSALNFAAAAAAAGCGRIIYLGGLGKDGDPLSRHLISRHRVGEELRSKGSPVTEFRAAIIVGSGSVSFEMIRYLVERLPVIPTNRFLQARCQPLAVRDALSYLISCLEKPETAGRIIEIGGGYLSPLRGPAAHLRGHTRPEAPVYRSAPLEYGLWQHAGGADNPGTEDIRAHAYGESELRSYLQQFRGR
ncbi:MAG: NmrA family NAD(P)-binding protein [Proteobacteria bacterium]|nr:NmrA family NAD(P)-binding protein [Pseudomonadota bacterium]MBU2573978.1 NmrA family NAD(P)-binding protein [Elusimicrobiota bacterium]